MQGAIVMAAVFFFLLLLLIRLAYFPPDTRMAFLCRGKCGRKTRVLVGLDPYCQECWDRVQVMLCSYRSGDTAESISWCRETATVCHVWAQRPFCPIHWAMAKYSDRIREAEREHREAVYQSRFLGR